MKQPMRLSVFTLAMLNVAAIASLRGLPSNAELGMSSVFFLVFAAVVFLIPSALVSAELATTFKGGVFDWVKEAFGSQLGFLAIWLQWIQNVIWFPIILSFAAGTLAFIINPALAKSGLFTAIVILIVYWGSTLLAFQGGNLAGLLGSWGVIIGTIIPGVLIIVLAIIFLAAGNQPAIPITAAAIMPDFTKFSTIVFAVGMFLSYAGMEMNAVHANEVDNPGSSFPKAILISVAVILALFILGSLAIALVVPKDQISLTAGVMEAYKSFLVKFHMSWAVPLVALLLIIGAFAGVITWIAGPSKGILKVGKHGYLPPLLQKTNQHGIQVNILILQGGIVTLFALIFVVIPNVSSSFWILSAITAQSYLIMYVMMFAAAIRLRKTHSDLPRPYRTPALPLVAGIGTVASAAAILLGFVPPSQWTSGLPLYLAILVAGMLALSVGPFIFYRCRKPTWVTDK